MGLVASVMRAVWPRRGTSWGMDEGVSVSVGGVRRWMEVVVKMGCRRDARAEFLVWDVGRCVG